MKRIVRKMLEKVGRVSAGELVILPVSDSDLRGARKPV